MKNYVCDPIAILSVLTILVTSVSGQGVPDDPAGDIKMEREAYMNGNRVLLYFQNTSEMAKWAVSTIGTGWSRWPNTMDGTRMLDGMAFMVAARVYLENGDTPVTSLEEIRSRNDLDTLYYLQTSYREEMDTDPTGAIEWGFYPVYGYFNENSEYPAMSNFPVSWPPSGWPAPGNTTKWPGEWNGRFGRGVIYADLETYYVINDAQDQEYLGPDDSVKYYPRPGVYIGDKRPDVSIQYGMPWGGIGLRVEVRGFQWNNEEAKDIIFWEYTLSNISDYALPELAVGFWVDNGIGGESDDENGFYNLETEMTYSWDIDGIGAGGLPTGIMGFAMLESPAISTDGIDNDKDGLTDERKDNNAGMLIGPYDGISDLSKFLQFYNMKEEDLRMHFEGDEDQDWLDGFDKNGNGSYAYFDSTGNGWMIENGEFAGDDVGLDGVGPGDLNYNGPDQGEGNHKPDLIAGVGCEPNFGSTDANEGDMIGTTAFRLFPVPSHRPPYTFWFKNDRSMWELTGDSQIVEYSGTISNLIMTFASGPFTFFMGTTERISIAELHAYDELSGLNSDEHHAPNLYQTKKNAQRIYENDYRFNIQFSKTVEITAGQTDTLDDIANSGASVNVTAGDDTVTVSMISYRDHPMYTEPIDRSFITGIGRYIDVLADGDISWPAEIKIYYTAEDLARSGVLESELLGIYYWDSDYEVWRLYSGSGADDFDRGTSTTGIDTRNAYIENREYEGFAWTSAYHLTAMRIGTEIDTLASEVWESIPLNPWSYRLYQNYPNPFNPATVISWQLAVGSQVELAVYNLLGKKVATLVSKKMNPGIHTYTFNGKNLASGVYYYQLVAGAYREVKKMVLLK